MFRSGQMQHVSIFLRNLQISVLGSFIAQKGSSKRTSSSHSRHEISSPYASLDRSRSTFTYLFPFFCVPTARVVVLDCVMLRVSGSMCSRVSSHLFSMKDAECVVQYGIHVVYTVLLWSNMMSAKKRRRRLVPVYVERDLYGFFPTTCAFFAQSSPSSPLVNLSLDNRTAMFLFLFFK